MICREALVKGSWHCCANRSANPLSIFCWHRVCFSRYRLSEIFTGIKRMKNVLFINVPHIGFSDFISPQRNAKVVTKKDGSAYGNVLTDMPLGILSLSSYIKKFASEAPRIDLLDFNCELSGAEAFPFASYREFFLDVLKRSDSRPDIVGISALFST